MDGHTVGYTVHLNTTFHDSSTITNKLPSSYEQKHTTMYTTRCEQTHQLLELASNNQQQKYAELETVSIAEPLQNRQYSPNP